MLVFDGDKVQTLAKLVYYQEVKRIKNNPYRSEYDRAFHLRQSRDSYLSALSLTKLSTYFTEDEGMYLNQDQKTAGTKFKEYLEYVVGYAVSCIRNIHLRKEYYWSVENYACALKEEIRGIDDTELGFEKARDIFNKLEVFKRAAYEGIVKKADKPYRALSKLSRPRLLTFPKTYDKVRKDFLKERAVMMNTEAESVQLVLEDNRRMITSMLDSMVKENNALSKFLKGLKWAGKVVLVLTVTTMVIDALMAKGGFLGSLEALTKDAINLGIGYLIGSMVEVATAAALEALLGVIFVAGAPLLAVGIAAVLAIGAGFAVAYFAAPYVAKAVDDIFNFFHKLKQNIFGSENRGRDIHYQLMKKISVSDIQLYIAPPPDGLKLACQLAHKGGNSSIAG